jgi:hypothetical protein
LPDENALAAAANYAKNSGEASWTAGPINVFATYREVDQPELMFSILASFMSDNQSTLTSSLQETLRQSLSGKQSQGQK